MSTTDQILYTLQAYREIQANHRRDACPAPVFTKIFSPEASTATLIPDGSILLGLAEDGSPVQLDLYDPAAGPLLVAGDRGSGKTSFLQSLARASNLVDPGDIQFGVLTPFPEEWAALESLPNCLGIWPALHSSAQVFLSQLINWAEALPKTRQAVLLLCDGLDLMAGGNFQYQPDLRWLLRHGPERQVWPVVTVNPGRLTYSQTWLDYFHTRVIGQTKRESNELLRVEAPEISLADLIPGKQFGLSRSDGWLKFWLPPLA
jgi:hypothetical protein